MSRGARRLTRATMVLALLLTVGGYIALRHSVPVLEPASCDAAAAGQPVSLEVSQAGIAATIAGVAQHRALPTYAVTVALATALQESKLTNLHSGDRDSVGVFQQRPSEGWGPAQDLEDPVYASSKFFAALTQVRDYQVMPVYQAAQAVQHSADGNAYAQYSAVAGRLAAAFTGQRPHAVWCCTRGRRPAPAGRGEQRIGPRLRTIADAHGIRPGRDDLGRAGRRRVGHRGLAGVARGRVRHRQHQLRGLPVAH